MFQQNGMVILRMITALVRIGTCMFKGGTLVLEELAPPPPLLP